MLSNSLEAGISLAYPENDIFDAENGEAIYKECVRQANIVIKYGQNTTDILRAHMIMVILHSAYGNFEAAEMHAKEFPWRPDMTIWYMKATIAHFENDYEKENTYQQSNFMYHLEAMMDDLMLIAVSYRLLGDYENAEYTFLKILDIINIIFKDEEIMPRIHCREYGDIYFLLAALYLGQNREEDAMRMVEKMVEYDTKVLPRFVPGQSLHSPLLCNSERNFYWTAGEWKEKLLLKLKNPALDSLKENEKFCSLLDKVKQL